MKRTAAPLTGRPRPSRTITESCRGSIAPTSPVLAVGVGDLDDLRRGQRVLVGLGGVGTRQGVAQEFQHPALDRLGGGTAGNPTGQEVAGGAGPRVFHPPDRAPPGVDGERAARHLDAHTQPCPALNVRLDLLGMGEGGHHRGGVLGRDGDHLGAIPAGEAQALVRGDGVDQEVVLEDLVLQGRAFEGGEAQEVAGRVRPRRVIAAGEGLGGAQGGVQGHALPAQVARGGRGRCRPPPRR